MFPGDLAYIVSLFGSPLFDKAVKPYPIVFVIHIFPNEYDEMSVEFLFRGRRISLLLTDLAPIQEPTPLVAY
tara:strand:+ start:160 stop:375 length:216 start_codon:yes stop_codon:yes gene_type:complete